MIRRRHPASALLVDPLVALTGCAVGTANTIDDAAYDKAPALPWPVTVTGLSGVDEVAPTRSISSRRPSATPPCRSSKRQAPS
ncbi:MAG: hypothetical protein J0H70_02445, partial [Microbacterium chocolatum]|nr:hypothetical protein [Microbacterium chocolatum]